MAVVVGVAHLLLGLAARSADERAAARLEAAEAGRLQRGRRRRAARLLARGGRHGRTHRPPVAFVADVGAGAALEASAAASTAAAAAAARLARLRLGHDFGQCQIAAEHVLDVAVLFGRALHHFHPADKSAHFSQFMRAPLVDTWGVHQTASEN